MSGLFRRDDVTLRYILFPREIFRRDEEDRRRRCRGHRRGGLTKYPAEKIRGTAGVVRELCGLVERPGDRSVVLGPWSLVPGPWSGDSGLRTEDYGLSQLFRSLRRARYSVPVAQTLTQKRPTRIPPTTSLVQCAPR